VIHLVSPLTLNGRFSTQDLPDSLHLPLLRSMTVPRIVSSSMAPTIQEGDRLELNPPSTLTIGSIVVFRNDAMLVCHRITAIGPQGTLSTRGDATQDTYEMVQPGSVIGVLTGVMRAGTHVSLGQNPHISSATPQSINPKGRVRTALVRSVIRSIHTLGKCSFFQHMLAMLLRWTGMVDVLIPASIQSLRSHSKIASFTLRKYPQRTALLPAVIGQKPENYIIRLGPWGLAQYDPATKSLQLRQSLRDAGLEPLIRSLLR
jgi:hypothetical protein